MSARVDEAAAQPLEPPAPSRGETLIFRVAALATAVHVADDGFVSPERGTSALDHALAGGVSLLLLVAAIVVYPRIRPGARAAIAFFLGALSLLVGILALAHAGRAGPSGDDWSGIALVPASLVLVLVAAHLLWRSRKAAGHRYLRRVLLAAGAAVGVYWLVLPLGVALLATHRPREAAAAVDLGRPAREIVARTSDELRLRGRYVPSRNRAAVIVFPGSNSRAGQARMLVRHGYGVLMLDMRGYRTSDGDPNAFGWGSTKDIDAGVRFLRTRADVDAGRIGGIGFSVGGEQMIETAARNPLLRAVVSEGAGARSIREALLLGRRAWLSLPSYAVQTTAIALLSGTAPPPALDDLAARIAPRSLFLIYAEHGEESERTLQPAFYAAAHEPKALWKVAGAGHTGGFAAAPAEYERRVAGFFDRALLGRAAREPARRLP
jgi:uncharacterized protein